MAEKNFGARSTALEVIAGHDLHGRDAIVTGGASGIGVETVRALATAGARVVIATRDRAKGESVAATLRKETGSGAIEFRSLDLGSLASVRAFVAEYLKLSRKTASADQQRGNHGDAARLHSRRFRIPIRY